MTLEGLDVRAFVEALSVPTEEALGALSQLQRQPAAWQLAFDLLANSNATCRFYGAHTLQAKIAQDWDTLDESRQEALRGEIIRVVVENCDGPAHVLKKTTQALATYALITVPERWENFLPSAIEAIQERAREAGRAGAGAAVLDLLEVFPEELNRAVVGSAHSGKLVQDVKASLPAVLRILTGAVCGLPGSPAAAADAPEFARQLGQSAAGRVRAWQAILQWLQFGVSDGEVFVELLRVCIGQLQTLAAHQLSGDAHADADEIAAAAAAADDMLSNMGMAARYARSIGTLVLERFGEPWTTQVLAWCAESGNGADALTWGAMLISFGETYTEFIVSHVCDPELAPHIGTFLRLMLALTRFPGSHGIDEEISDQPLNFWYLLQEALVDYEFDADGDGDPGKAAAVAATRAAVGQVYVELLTGLVAKCAFPVGAGAWVETDKDERDRFMSYRREAGDALLNAYYVLRGDMLGLLVDEVLGSMAGFSMAHWQNVEALLFALRSIGEAVPEAEDAHLPRLFSADMLAARFMPLLQAAPDGDRATQWALQTVKAGVVALIGAYSDWWRGHPELLALVVPCVTSSLSQPPLVQAAVAAFRRICESCRDQLTVAAASMVALARDVLLAGAAVPAREQQRVFESVAEVVMALPPRDQPPALAPLTSALIAAIYDDLAQVEAGVEARIAALADRLRLVDALARGLQFPDEAEEHALAGDPDAGAMLAAAAQSYQAAASLGEFRGSLLGALGRILELAVWPRDARTGMAEMDDGLLECVLSVVNSSARRSPHAFALPFDGVTALVARAWDVFVARHSHTGERAFGRRWTDQCPTLLLCISQLATVSAAATPESWHVPRPSQAEMDCTLSALLSRAIGDTCAGIAREADTPAAAIEQQPVIVEYLLELCTRALQTRPEHLASGERPAVADLCELCTHALLVPSRLALKPTAYFLAALIRLSGANGALLRPMWDQYGPAWLRATLAGIGGMHPRSLLPNLTELLFAMVKNHLATTRQWMAQLLAEPDFPSPHVDNEAKRLFTRQLLATRSFVRAKAIVAEFSTRCRNIHGTGYAG
ncbi:hypothetical protein H4R19_001157 [Coemansia spiralis]|nr:hypothetical protein H4R19_001157 [Coemansia spiralis]